MLRGAWTIYRKEMVETLRDRRTLFFMLMIPMVATPLLIVSVAWFLQHLDRSRAEKTVLIAADAASRGAYVRIVHDWFRGGDFASSLRDGDAGVLAAFFEDGVDGSVPEIPASIFEDAEALCAWMKAVRPRVREHMDSLKSRLKGPLSELSAAERETTIQAFRVLVRGLALVEFEDPAGLAEPGDDFEVERATLSDLPYLRRAAFGIEEKRIHGYLHVARAPTDLGALLANDQTSVGIAMVHNSTQSLSREANYRVSMAMGLAGRRLVGLRLEGREIEAAFMEPFELRKLTDLATHSEIAFTVVGGMLPYIVILYAFLGALYPAIDLGAGEKERHTLETLLLAPVSRTSIAAGKSLVVFTTALTASLLGVTAIGGSLYLLIPEGALEQLNLHVEPVAILAVALLAVPPAATFAGLLPAISIYARSFKEAQSYMAPLNIVIILPAMAGILPDLEMNWRIALVPLANISVLCREFLKGDVHWGYYGLSLASCVALALACLAFAVRQFHREEVLFRS